MSIPSKTMAYVYDAGGNKLRKIVGTTATDYINGIQYDNGSITFIQTEEGRVLDLSGTPDYEYTLTDHLGNSRVNFDSSHGGNVATQSNDYYPFGLVATQPSTTSPKNEYLYNKKELQEELGQYDYGARLYDPVIARWTTPDPYSAKYTGLSPYNYVTNNPIKRIDPDGKDVIFDITRDKNGNITAVNIRSTVFITGSGASDERANELTGAAAKEFKPGKSNGVDISFGVTYQYSKGKKESDLKQGENLLIFSADPEHDADPDQSKIRRSGVNDQGDGLGAHIGTVYSKGTSNYTVLHETGHLLGLQDQYVDDPNDNGPPYAQGYGHDLMGQEGQMGFNKSYYKSFSDKASILLKQTISDSYYISPIYQNIIGTSYIPYSGFVNNNNAVRIP